MRNTVLTLIMTLCCALYSQDILLCGTEPPANALEMERIAKRQEIYVVNYCKEVVIESDFEMQPGTTLTIEK